MKGWWERLEEWIWRRRKRPACGFSVEHYHGEPIQYETGPIKRDKRGKVDALSA